MIRFHLFRSDDESGVSGVGRVADGVRFRNGKCALSWRTKHTSIAVYDDIATLLRIHGHGGKTQVRFDDCTTSTMEPFLRAQVDFYQDRCENAAYACIGGLAARIAPRIPEWITKEGAEYAAEWLAGYEFAALQLDGEDWRTCSYGWAPAVTIGADTLAKPEVA